MNNAYVMNTCQRFVIIHNSLICMMLAISLSWLDFLLVKHSFIVLGMDSANVIVLKHYQR